MWTYIVKAVEKGRIMSRINGFQSCRRFQVCADNGKFPAGMLVKKLKAGALDGRKWVYSYSPVMDITGQTNLSFLHAHYFMRGMFFFLILLLLNIKKRAA